MTSDVLNPTRILMTGAESFDECPGGMNRYFGDLLGWLSDAGYLARGVVAGPGPEGGPTLYGSGSLSSPVLGRLIEFRRAALETGRGAQLLDAHFALYALPVMATRLRKLPMVVHFQGPWADESFGSASGFLGPLAKRQIERLVYRRASQCVVLSNAFKRILIERYRVSPFKINVIPPGVDLQLFSPGDRADSRQRLGLPDEAWVAVAPRRLVHRTGIAVLLEVWARLATQTSRPMILVIAGEGPLGDSLRARAQELKLSECVRFVGEVSETTLVDCYRASDVCLVPSLDLEGFGLVVLESFACGTPVIASTSGGLPEAVGPIGNHLLVPPADAESLAAMLLRCLEEDGLPLPSPQSCRRYAEEFSWSKIGPRNASVYQAALRRRAPRKPRVVFLDHVARLSGGELALLKLLKAMPDIEAHVILAEEGPLLAKLMEAGISTEVMSMDESARGLSKEKVRPGSLPAVGLLAAASYVLRLAAWLRKLRPDLVHTNSLKAALYGGLAAKLASIPVIWHIRDTVTSDYLPDAAVTLTRTMANLIPAGIIANSSSTLASLGPLRCPQAVIGSPVDIGAAGQSNRAGTSHSPAQKGPGEELTVGMVGRIAPFKGQDIFLEAFSGAFPDGGHRAVLAGSPLFGEEDYESRLKSQAESLGLNGRVEFAGFVEDVPGLLHGLDVLVHASRTPEPFGQVVVEGMAAGLPVVAAAAGGPAEIVEDGKTGLLYPPGDTAALGAALKRLAKDAHLRKALGQAARRKAEEFDPSSIGRKVMDFYGVIGLLDRVKGPVDRPDPVSARTETASSKRSAVLPA